MGTSCIINRGSFISLTYRPNSGCNMDDRDSALLQSFVKEVRDDITAHQQLIQNTAELSHLKDFVWASGITASCMVEIIVTHSVRAAEGITALHGSELYGGEGEMEDIEKASKEELELYKRKMEYLLALLP